jgi:hypothetical protein
VALISISLSCELYLHTFCHICELCVQAALGPVALDFARKEDPVDTSKLELASQVLTIAVLSILVTAPIGAVGIHVAGPRLLGKTVPQPVDNAANSQV